MRKLASFTAKLYSYCEIYSENGEKYSEKRQVPTWQKEKELSPFDLSTPHFLEHSEVFRYTPAYA